MEEYVGSVGVVASFHDVWSTIPVPYYNFMFCLFYAVVKIFIREMYIVRRFILKSADRFSVLKSVKKLRAWSMVGNMTFKEQDFLLLIRLSVKSMELEE